MKPSILTMLIFCISSIAFGQVDSGTKEIHFGATINSSVSADVGSFSIAPTATYYSNGSEFGLGFAIHPFKIKNPRIFGIELSYRYYPNGISNRFNLFFEVNSTYTNSFRDHLYKNNNYQTTYQFLNLLGGYGFELRVFDGLYLGTSLNIGGSTRSRKDTNTGTNNNYGLFEQFDLDGAIRLRIGYRF